MRENIPHDALNACLKAANRSLYTCRSLQQHIKEEREQLQAARESAGGDATLIERIDDSIMEHGRMLATMAPREEFLDRRLEHAVKCLVRKKLYAEGVEDLMALCEERGLLAERGILQMVSCTMGTRIMNVAEQDELDRNCWKIGIDLAMLECEPDLADSDSLYGPVLEHHIGRIFSNTMMAAYGSKLNQMLESENYREAIYGALAEKYRHPDDGMAEITLPKDLSEMLVEMLSAGLSEKTVTEQLKDELDAAKTKLADQDNAIRKAVAPVQAQADRAASRIAELETELRAANARSEALQDALSDRDRKLSETAAMLDDAGLPELPESGIIFAGGHRNMTKKLMQDHPGWTFIDGRDVNFPEFRNPVMVFFWDQHISHPTFYRVRKFAPPSVPQAYLKSTNLDMLETEMRKAWAAAGAGR